jgi:type I restriction enzyme S subunit
MELKKGYKQTETGYIPDEWEWNELQNYISFISYGFTNPMPTTDDGVFLITANDINGGRIKLESARKTSVEAYKRLLTDKSRPKPNDILLTKDGTLGRVAMVGNEVICINQSVAVIRPNARIIPKYLKLLLESSYYQKTMIENAGGSTIKHIYITIVDRMKIAVPPTVSEQTAIATALSDADSLVDSLEKLIAKKKLIKQGAMQELLKPKKGWIVKKLGELGKTFGGLSGKSKSDFTNGIYPYIPFMNIMSNPVIDIEYFDYVNIKQGENQNKALKGDLFFNGSSETPEEVGMCSVLTHDIPKLYLNSFCFGFRLFQEAEATGLFLSYFFRSPFGRSLFFSSAQGATRYNLSKANFLKLEVQLPSKEEQTRIAQIISEIDLEINLLSAKMEKSRTIKQGMMQNLLTGKIRLV